MESSSISFSEPKYAIKMEDLPIFKGLGAKLGLAKKIRVPRRVGKKIRVTATLYTRAAAEVDMLTILNILVAITHL